MIAEHLKYVVHNDKVIQGFFGDYRFLSNFHETLVYLDGMRFSSSEAAYQAAKTLDLSERHRFISMRPSESKKAGQNLVLRADWAAVKFDVMRAIVFDKFYRNTALREQLLNTEDRYLEETNHWNDTTWGVCNGKGSNALGMILMATRGFWQHS